VAFPIRRLPLLEQITFSRALSSCPISITFIPKPYHQPPTFPLMLIQEQSKTLFSYWYFLVICMENSIELFIASLILH